ncbi:MAG: hypothetical protein QM796_01695 [Chthoniobacteraceae bacterium]
MASAEKKIEQQRAAERATGGGEVEEEEDEITALGEAEALQQQVEQGGERGETEEKSDLSRSRWRFDNVANFGNVARRWRRSGESSLLGFGAQPGSGFAFHHGDDPFAMGNPTPHQEPHCFSQWPPAADLPVFQAHLTPPARWQDTGNFIRCQKASTSQCEANGFVGVKRPPSTGAQKKCRFLNPNPARSASNPMKPGDY